MDIAKLLIYYIGEYIMDFDDIYTKASSHNRKPQNIYTKILTLHMHNSPCSLTSKEVYND